MRQESVYGTDVYIVWRACFYRVLEERLQSENNILHALHVLNAVDELVHRTLALGQLHLSVLRPKFVVSHLCVRFRYLLRLTLEQFVRNGREGVVAHACDSAYGKAAYKTQ